MRIVDPGSQTLTNAEVLAHIRSLEAKYESQNRSASVPEDLTKAMRDVTSILGLGTQPTAYVEFTPQKIHDLTITLRASPFKLLPAEILQILNHVPRDRTELAMLLEDAEERFDDAIQEELLKAIASILDLEATK